MEQITMGELFAGIGGFSLAGQHLGIKSLWAVESDPYKQVVYGYNYPDVPIYDDVKTFCRDGDKPQTPTIITAGFPCQDISIAAAGKAKGINGPKSSLWYEALRIIGILRPQFIVLENSPIIRVRGLGEVLRGLSECGYDAEWRTISCRAFGLPHIRKRWFCVAYPHEIGRVLYQSGQPAERRKIVHRTNYEEATKAHNLASKTFGVSSRADEYNTVCQLSRLDDGISQKLLSQMSMALGDAVSPTVAHYVLNCVLQAKKQIDLCTY